MFNPFATRLSSYALAAAMLLFACGASAAQESRPAPATQPAPAAETPAAQTPAATAAAEDAARKTDAPEVASNVAPAGEARAAAVDGADGERRFEFETRAARAADLVAAAERPLFVSDKFEWQQTSDPQAGPTPQPARTSLTPEQKMRRAARNAFLSPVGYGTTLFSAAVTEYTEDDLPHKTTEDRFADFASRFAIRFTTRATNTLLGGGVYPILFKQDPRYRKSDSKNYFKRALHAASRVFVTDDDDGNLEPNVSRWAGSLTSSAIANLYEQSTPGRDRIGTDATFRRFASSFTSGMLNNIIREFIGDLF